MSMNRVEIFEVVARDGLQNEARFVETADKIKLIDALSETGLAKIEATAFVSPKAVPNMRDATEVMAGIKRAPGIIYSALVPNLRGAEAAITGGVQEVNLVFSASESHNKANVRMSCEESLTALSTIISTCKAAGLPANVSIATSFGCPFEGIMPAARVLGFIQRCTGMGVSHITLADTTGMANPAQVEALVSQTRKRFPDLALTLHFHDTRGMGLANVYAAYHAGARRFDAALGGIGGCPFAPGATGNICTEDTVHMFEQMGVETGVNLPKLLEIAKTLPALVGHDTFGSVLKAGRSCDLHPMPK
jgi:hydroxymethylglutaryl-CoA lyase